MREVEDIFKKLSWNAVESAANEIAEASSNTCVDAMREHFLGEVMANAEAVSIVFGIHMEDFLRPVYELAHVYLEAQGVPHMKGPFSASEKARRQSGR